jgi:hypothetical protein
MTGLEWITLGVIAVNFVVGTIGGAIWKTQRDKVKDEKVRSVIDAAVRAAEELKLSKQLSTSKADFVWKVVEKEFPALAKDKPAVEMLINAAVQAAGLGATGKQG